MPAAQQLTADHKAGFQAHAVEASKLLAQLQSLQSQQSQLHQQALAIADQAAALKQQLHQHANRVHAQIDPGQVEHQDWVSEQHQTLARALQRLEHVGGLERNNTATGLHHEDLSGATQAINYVLAQSTPAAEDEHGS